MRTFALLATLLVLAGLFALPVASAGCNETLTCAYFTGGYGCRIPPGKCTGDWLSRHSALVPGVGELYLDGVLLGTCQVTPGLGCDIPFSLTWHCGNAPRHIETYTRTPVDTAYDEMWTQTC